MTSKIGTTGPAPGLSEMGKCRTLNRPVAVYHLSAHLSAHLSPHLSPHLSAHSNAHSNAQTSRAGFTLIEILAVVLIIGFISAMVFPNLRLSGSSGRHDQALNVASHLELARQNAVMTGKIHRVLLNVDDGSYRVEWYVRESGDDDDYDSFAARQRSIWQRQDSDVFKPPVTGLAYEPIPGQFGNRSYLADPFYFDGVDTSDGWLDAGDVAVVFEHDGTTDRSQIVITDPDGFATTLDILPILDSVRIRHESAHE